MGTAITYEWDEAKAEANEAKHGIPFKSVEKFEWTTALVGFDNRSEYGEVREFALGIIADRLHVLVYTRRDGTVRVISLRKANAREQRSYDDGQ